MKRLSGPTLAGVLTLAVACACSSKSSSTQGPATLPSFAAANAVPSTDPTYEGQYRFLYDAWGTEGLQGWPPTDFMLGLMKSEPDVFGNQFASFGFIFDPNDDFPVGFKRGLVDPTRVSDTCALCHTTKLPDGRLWFGSPNESLELGRFTAEVNKRWVAAGHPAMASDLALTKMSQLGPGRTNAESSDYPVLVGADFPAYFTLGQRTRLNYLGTGGDVRSEASMAIYTFGAGSPDDQLAQVPFPTDDRLQPFLDWFGALQPPQGPAQDATLVASGEQVFAKAGCGGCHHIGHVELDGVVTSDVAPDTLERAPGDDPKFPRGSINTDPKHRLLQTDASASGNGGSSGDGGASDGGSTNDNGYDNLLRFIIAHHIKEGGTDGYVVTDVRGLWATAPYLHNGSVPTLEDLLKPAAQRPKTFQLGSFTFDTTAPGNSNQGHEFGTKLADADKTALLAYLRSL
jgi:hypothetical protein